MWGFFVIFVQVMPYLYRHIRLDKNEPFYIGIGLKDNDNYKRAYQIQSRRNIIWKRIVSKTKICVEILMDNMPENFIKQKEIEFIKLYGRIDLGNGTLANLTDGGEGSNGIVVSEKTRLKLSESGKGKTLGRKLTNEHRKKLSNAKIGKKISQKHIDILKNINIGNKYGLGKKRTEESKFNASLIRKDNVYNMRLVLDLQTGIFYNSAKRAAFSKNIIYGSLVNMLNGRKNNKTSLIYV